MKNKKALVLATGAVFAAVMLSILFGGRFALPDLKSGGFFTGGYIAGLEANIKEAIPFGGRLKSAAIRMRLFLGQLEQNSVFISGGSLIENPPEPDDAAVESNLDWIGKFSGTSAAPCYFMLIPTKGEIQRNLLPVNASAFAQRSFIESSYSKLSGITNTIDVYAPLYTHSNEYIYYRTDPSLNQNGGYYVYANIIKRVGGDATPLNSYSRKFLTYSFLGRTFTRLPFGGVDPDIFTAYALQNSPYIYSVTHGIGSGQSDPQIGLYNTNAVASRDWQNLVLWGLAPVTGIDTKGLFGDKLLIFADSSVLSYIPFLADTYSSVTIVDLERASAEELAYIKTEDYKYILFGYDVSYFSQHYFGGKLQYVTH